MTSVKPKIAFWFRYGPAEHTELFHAIPRLVVRLAEHCEVHYFGMNSGKPVPQDILDHAVVHHLPFRVNRKSTGDKAAKMLLWYLCLPFIALYCRWTRVTTVYIDDFLPLGAWFARLFFGPNVAIMVADFLLDAYADRVMILKPLARLVNALDLAAWRRQRLIFTHAKATRTFLAQHGVPPERVLPVYDPCDTQLYCPVPRGPARARWGYGTEEVVLVHHGILHPNKGTDRILRWLAPLMKRHPQLRFLIIGTGPDLEALKQLARSLGIAPSVTFGGWLPTPQDVNVGLNASDIGLAMRTGQHGDSFHVTGALVHGMAAGLPILAARLGGMTEIVQDGDSGFLFDPESEAEFGEALTRLVVNPALREQLGRKALQLARQYFDMDSVADQIAQPLVALSAPPGE